MVVHGSLEQCVGMGQYSRAHVAPPLSALIRSVASMDNELDTTSSDDDLEITHVTRRELHADARLKSQVPGSAWVPIYTVVEADQFCRGCSTSFWRGGR